MIKPYRSRAAFWSLAALALCLSVAPGSAQDAKPAPTPAPQAESPPAAQAKLDAILARYDKAMEDWQASLRNAESDDEARKLYKNRPGEEFLDELEAVAREAKGTPTAAQAWSRYASIAAGFGNAKQVAKAVDVLVEEHIDSAGLAGIPDMLDENPRVAKANKAEDILRRMMEKSPHKSVQAPAMFSLGTRLMQSGRKSTPERNAEGRALLEKVQKEYTGVASPYGPDYAARAAGQLFELDHLQVGKAPPDFEAVDENGVKFNLSDYRGKVVILDFWGIW